jgi:hypothetical protein
MATCECACASLDTCVFVRHCLVSISCGRFGRGASDHKGPLLAFILAAAEAHEYGAVDGRSPPNFLFCLEGEGENGSVGLKEVRDCVCYLYFRACGNKMMACVRRR